MQAEQKQPLHIAYRQHQSSIMTKFSSSELLPLLVDLHRTA